MKRLEDYETMKGITMLLVVFAHVTRMFAPQGVVPITYSPLLTEITNFIYVFHMPAFVAVTGAVYYFVKREKGKYRDEKAFIKNKFERLLIPFLFFSFVVVFPTLYYLDLRESILDFSIKEVFLGASGTHLWYSAMIFMVFVLFNKFESFINANNDSINWILFTTLSIFSFVIPNVFQATNVLRYTVFFYAGYWFQKNREKVYSLLSNKLFGLTGITILVYLVLFYSPINEIFLLNQIFQVVGGISGTAMIYTVSDKISRKRINQNVLFQEIIGSSYGIYLFHPMLVYLLSHWVKNIEINPLLIALFNFVVALFLSLILTRAMRKLNLQIFIGEARPTKLKSRAVSKS